MVSVNDFPIGSRVQCTLHPNCDHNGIVTAHVDDGPSWRTEMVVMVDDEWSMTPTLLTLVDN